MKYFITIIFTLIFNLLFSQIEMSSNGLYRVYRSIKETQGINPDSIHYLDLGNNCLRKFPKEVLEFKNLYVLEFNNKDIYYYFDKRPDLLSEKEKEKVQKERRKRKYNRDVDDYWCKKNKNKFNKIPKEIASLKELETITVGKKTYINANKNNNLYTSLEEIEGVNPDSVRYLDLSNNGIKKFPIEVLKFKNLVFLNLDNNVDSYYFDIKRNNQGLNYWVVRNKKNKSYNIPKEISTLSKLETIRIKKSIFMKKRLKSIRLYLPNCIVEY